MKFERGTTERVLVMRHHREKFPELEEYFPFVFDFEKLGDTLESDISSGAATSFRH